MRYSVLDFYRTGDSDDTAAFQRAVEAVNNSDAEVARLWVPNVSNYKLSSTALVSSPLRFYRSNVAVRGFRTPIQLTGTDIVHFFHSHEYSNISYEGLHLIGNSKADGFANGAAIAFTNQSTNAIESLTVSRCVFDNFRGDYWYTSNRTARRNSRDPCL